MLTFKVDPEHSHIVPTHLAKILEADCNDNVAGITFLNVGSEMPCVADENGMGYLVLCLDGRYRYMSLNGEIKIVRQFVNAKIVER